MASQQQNPNENLNTMIPIFMEITSASAEEAQFYLESHNFDVDAAVSTFLESNSTAAIDAPSAAAIDAPSRISPSASLSPIHSPSRSRSHSPPPAIDSQARSQYNLRARRPSSGNNNNNSNNSGRGRAGGIRTLSDLNRISSGDGSGSESDTDRPPEYFTGGQKSGMLVQDPSRGNNIDAFFEQARQMGAMPGPADVHQPSSSSRSFTGAARLLSGGTVSSAVDEQPPAAVTHTITFWRNGFTVDNGPLRRFHDQENSAFLESIKNSECPKELEPADRRTTVQVNLVRREENCPEPEKQRQVSFQGVGRTLGTSSSITSEPSADATAVLAAPSPVMGLVVDENLPSTSIQLRLADGTRMVSRFNFHHTVRDIHGFIDASRPGRAGTYTLQTVGFPPKKLTELDQSIEQAGLANSVVIQKF